MAYCISLSVRCPHQRSRPGAWIPVGGIEKGKRGVEHSINLSIFASRYAYFDAKRATPAILGKAMNNFRFGFKHRMVNGCSEYWLCEK